MKKLFFILPLFLSSLLVSSQDFTGIHTSNYFPLQNIANNPSGIVTDSVKWHINILSGQVVFVSDINNEETEVYKRLANAGILSLDKLLATTDNATIITGKIIFPSVAYKFNHKNALSIHFDMRANGIYRASHANIAEIFDNVQTPDGLEDLQNENLKGVVNTWTEYNLTYSRLLFENEKHVLAGGITLKLLQGGGSGYFDMDGIDVSYNKDQINHMEFDLTYAFNEALHEIAEDGKIKFDGDNGIGANIGFSYFYKDPNQPKKPYLFRAGLTINDIGSIKHSKNRGNKTYHFEMDDVPYSKFHNITSISALVDTLKNSVDFTETEGGSYSLSLPTTYTLNGDYCYKPTLFLNASFSYQPSVYNNIVKSFKADFFTMRLTPRFENKTWGFYLPLGYNNILGVNAGIAARWKYIFAGSGTLIGNLFKSDGNTNQVYFGLNIPIGKTY